MNIVTLIPAITEAIISIIKIACAAGMSQEEIIKLKLAISKEIERINEQQKKDEDREIAIIRGEPD